MSRFRGVRPVWVPMVAALALMTGFLGLASGAAAAGHTYHVEAVPNPAGASNSALFGISCPMVAGCIAVGYATTSPKSAALVETYAGGTWTPTALHQGFAFPGLEAVWCASMTSCVAVGDVGSLGANGAQPLVETLTDGTWTPTSPPLPETGITGSLDAISCVTTEWCVAGGFFMDSEDNTYSLLEVLSNGTWTPEVGPTPSQSTQSGIRSVRCFTTTSCDAVGFYGISSTYGLLETLSGNEWTASALGGKGILNSLSCVSPGSCLAVGSTVHGGGYTETLSGTTWTRGTLPHPGGGNGNGMAGVSCPKVVSSCVAIGGWRDPRPKHYYPRLLIETESDGTWAPTEVPAPSGLMNAKDIACPKVSACVGIGLSDPDGGPAEAAIEQPGS